MEQNGKSGVDYMKYKDYLNLFLDLNSIPFSDNGYRSFLINTIFSPSQSSEKYYNLQYYNGNELIYTEQVLKGEKGKYLGVPQKSSDSQYSYTFAGWSKDIDDNIVDADAREGIIANRKVYACYTAILRTYTVTFKNDTGSTILYTQIINYGQTATYAGATPTSSEDASLAWLGWATSANAHQANAVLTNVQSDMIVYAAFESAVEVAEITDSWDTIIANIDNGTYSTKYKVGNYKPLDLGTEGTINMQIVAMDADELASGGYAPITFVGMELLNAQLRMKPRAVNTGGWESTVIRGYLNDTVLPLITAANSNVSARLQKVNKYSSIYSSGIVKDGQTTIDKLWIPSSQEILGVTYCETKCVVYNSIYKNATTRIKNRNNTATEWWLRSAGNDTNFCYVGTNGWYNYNIYSNTNQGVALGFCLGLEQETIEDSWETILANTNPSATYSIGDTKMIDLGTEGKHLMEIVAFDEDDKADGSGKAKITWISKTLLNTLQKMNNSNTSSGDWEGSNLRSYLRSTIKPLIPSEVRSAIVEVTKGQHGTKGMVTNTDDVWIPSAYEISGSNYFEKSGTSYSQAYPIGTSGNAKRTRKTWWWTRTVSMTNQFYGIGDSGTINGITPNIAHGIALGFCTD